MDTRPRDKEIEDALNRVDMPEFFAPTDVAGGHEAVQDILLQTPEAQFLVQHAADAVPRIVRRLETPRGVRHEWTRIALFTILQAAGDPRALPALLHYVESLSEADAAASNAPGHPFRYAVDAINALVPVEPDRAGDPYDWFSRRREIADRVRAELERGGRSGRE
jgi:hypothetical protein